MWVEYQFALDQKIHLHTEIEICKDKKLPLAKSEMTSRGELTEWRQSKLTFEAGSIFRVVYLKYFVYIR